MRSPMATAPAPRPAPGSAPELIWGGIFDRTLGLAMERGLRPEAFLHSIGEQPRRPLSRIPLDLLARFLTWASETSGDPAFGLTLGTRFHPSDLGAYGYLLLSSATLGDAMNVAHRFAAFQQQGDAFGWKPMPDGKLELRYAARGLAERLRRQDTECTLAIVHATVQHLAGRTIRPMEVRVQHAAQPQARHMEAYFGCPIAYGDKHNALRYDPTLLALKLPGADPKLLAILTHYVGQELETLPPPGDERGRIVWAIRRSLSTSTAGIHSVARQCRLSERTLQRRLARQGLNFSGLVDSVRQEFHAELCKSGHHSRRDIAELLGFSDASALAKAMRRWNRPH
jgi:AraC-like DNA-binding protein